MNKLDIISWNITRRCHLRCPNCYVDGGPTASDGELTTEEGLRLIEEIASLNRHCMLILTGGEPLLRGDVFELARRAASSGLMVVVASNGPGADPGVAAELSRCGVKGVGVSLDSASPDCHDSFRGAKGAWLEAIAWIEACKRAGLRINIQMNVNKANLDQLAAMVGLARELDAVALNLFTLVCTGRAASLPRDDPKELEAALSEIADLAVACDDVFVRAKCAPQFKRIVDQKGFSGSLFARRDTFSGAGCLAGLNYCRITPEGHLTPCPYIEVSAGNVRSEKIGRIWKNSPLLARLRGEGTAGRCGACEYSAICSGCRAKALAAGGDIMGEDPSCPHLPRGEAAKEKIEARSAELKPVWSQEALARMEKVPHFLRDMVTSEVERLAILAGAAVITPEIMAQTRKKAIHHGAKKI